MWYYGAGETGPFPNNGGGGGVSKDCDLIKKCVTGVELDDGVGDAVLFGDCGDENNMRANVRGDPRRLKLGKGFYFVHFFIDSRNQII